MVLDANTKKFPKAVELIYTVPAVYKSSNYFALSPIAYIFYPFIFTNLVDHSDLSFLSTSFQIYVF